ncbi:MAG: NapC/NirT family cytochrome c [Candidatus Zixiibacteriota bacterium]|nr:MAG: NapC/NirT family cytochrome c [candidate division Zixibacteria bacterium]
MSESGLPRLAHNKVTALGGMIALATLMAIILMIVADVLTERSNPYFDIILLIILPTILIFGLLLIPLGMWLTWRRQRRTRVDEITGWPVVDLNLPSHRNATLVFVLGTVVFILLSSFGVYQAYHYSESVEFCGELCHTVMQPQYAAYKESSHARVSCTACHVGYGADWYAKSKLSGAYQVYATLADVFPRPIPTPIENLRPARETCEQCHWPEKHYSGRVREFVHYRYDEANTPWYLEMLIKTGGDESEGLHASGIHWHINKDVLIEYAARDEGRQDIPWVRYTNGRTGEVVVFQDTEAPLAEESLAGKELRRMDCLDCHNRPSHVFHSPDHLMDRLLLTGRISKALPEIKSIAVNVMVSEYDSAQEAHEAISAKLRSYYASEYPGLSETHSVEVDSAVVAVQHAFARNIFPGMKAQWSVYPSNIGHFSDIGCMRCHAGYHRAEDGRTITHECNACHTILAQGPVGDIEVAESQEGSEFRHPEDIDKAWLEMGCYECHDGTQP